MAMDCSHGKNARGLKIERLFESSRLAGELMACAYENLVPIRRQVLNPAGAKQLPDGFGRSSFREEPRETIKNGPPTPSTANSRRFQREHHSIE